MAESIELEWPGRHRYRNMKKMDAELNGDSLQRGFFWKDIADLGRSF